MARKKFQRTNYASIYQELDSINVTLAAGAALAEVFNLDITPITSFKLDVDVSVAALNGLAIYAKSGSKGRWYQIGLAQLEGYGRTDAGTDITTTPAGASFFIMFARRSWTHVMVKAKSAGAAKLAITPGGQ